MILQRTLVWAFYQRHAGFLAVVVYLAFGFMRASDHEAIMEAALISPFLLAGFVAIWTLYSLRAVSFLRKTLAAPEHTFLQNLRLLPYLRRWLVWSIVLGNVLGPVIGYAAWTASVGLKRGAFGPVAVVISAVLVLWVAAVWATDWRLHRPQPEPIRLPARQFLLPYWAFFLAYLVRHRPLVLALTKVVSCLLLTGVCRLYPTDEYDERLLLIGLIFSVITHAGLCQQFAAFEIKYLLLLRNMPFSRWQRFGFYALTFALLWLPEALILVRNWPLGPTPLFGVLLWLTGLVWLLAQHTLVYDHADDVDWWFRRVFAGVIIGTLLVMFGVPIWAWLLVGIGACLVELPVRRQ
jgi:hypothetical protein